MSVALAGLVAGVAGVAALASQQEIGGLARSVAVAGADTEPAGTSTPATTTTAESTTPAVTTTKRPSTTKRPAASRSAAAEPSLPAAGPQEEVLALVNEARAGAGCRALRADDRLEQAAQAHADDMSRRKYFAHDSPDGTGFEARVRRAGYPAPGAENIDKGYRDAGAVVRGWLDSPAHRENLLNCRLVAMGVGTRSPGDYWVLNLGR